MEPLCRWLRGTAISPMRRRSHEACLALRQIVAIDALAALMPLLSFQAQVSPPGLASRRFTPIGSPVSSQ